MFFLVMLRDKVVYYKSQQGRKWSSHYWNRFPSSAMLIFVAIYLAMVSANITLF